MPTGAYYEFNEDGTAVNGATALSRCADHKTKGQVHAANRRLKYKKVCVCVCLSEIDCVQEQKITNSRQANSNRKCAPDNVPSAVPVQRSKPFLRWTSETCRRSCPCKIAPVSRHTPPSAAPRSKIYQLGLQPPWAVPDPFISSRKSSCAYMQKKMRCNQLIIRLRVRLKKMNKVAISSFKALARA